MENEIIKNLETQLENYKNTKKILSDNIDLLNKDYNNLKKDRDLLKNQSQKDSKLITRLENDIVELKELKNTNKQLSLQNEKLKNDFSELNRENRLLQNEIDIKNKEIIDMKKQIEGIKDTHKTDLKNLRDRLELEKQQEILEIKQTYQEVINDKIEEIQNIKNKRIHEIEQYQDKYMKHIEKLESDRVNLKSQVGELKKQLDNKIENNL